MSRLEFSVFAAAKAWLGCIKTATGTETSRLAAHPEAATHSRGTHSHRNMALRDRALTHSERQGTQRQGTHSETGHVGLHCRTASGVSQAAPSNGRASSLRRSEDLHGLTKKQSGKYRIGQCQLLLAMCANYLQTQARVAKGSQVGVGGIGQAHEE